MSPSSSGLNSKPSKKDQHEVGNKQLADGTEQTPTYNSITALSLDKPVRIMMIF
jgi:hypothetical protein